MGHIFKLHNSGNNTINGWDISNKYGKAVTDDIQSPDGETARKEITSIPSPFARIDLVKTAFAKVVEIAQTTGTTDGKTIHHKMVSDCLDVGQLFFEMNRHGDKFKIMVWDKQNDLNELLKSSNPAHKQLGETYRIYMQQDGRTYNFDRMNQMYLLVYTNAGPGTAEFNIVGATSPATLFFTSANDLSYVTRDIIFAGGHRPFNTSEFCPLYKRDLDYLKYLWALKASINEFSTLFKEVDAYMTESFKLMNSNTRTILTAQTKTNFDALSDIPVGENVGHTVEIMQGIKLKKKTVVPGEIERQSGFVINSEYKINEHKPLVLPVETYTQDVVYTHDKWNKNNRAPYYVAQSPGDRILPNEGSKYPWLTVSDFLTDTIVRMPYAVNGERFFDGNINRVENQGKGCLLPLTDLFFEIFTVEQLCGSLPDGKKMFELQNIAGGVTAILRIPIKNNKTIEYRRIYFDAREADVQKNEGRLIDKIFSLSIMPMVKFAKNDKKHYRIALFETDPRSAAVPRNVELIFRSGTKTIDKQAYCKRDAKDINIGKSSVEAYSINDSFDRINVCPGDVQCVLVPKFRNLPASVNKQFTFAVDFGTTNTHIEYSVDGGNPVTFDMCDNDKQIHNLHHPNRDYSFFTQANEMESAIIHNFIPEKISEDSLYSFPIRTAFTEHTGINYDTSPRALVDGNIPFIYEKETYQEYLVLKTDLKWNAVPDKLVRLYMENLFILMRNKVILSGGNLNATKIVWFYPASMDAGRIVQFNTIWERLYKEYFCDNVADNLISMSESVAPFQYYKRRQGARTEVVTIDIGGGTTDVYVVETNLPKMLLSFRFASEAVFGDAHTWDSDKNGFVSLYKNQFMNVMQTNGLGDLMAVLQQTEHKKKSPDIIAFFFSLANNQKVKGNEALNFLEVLSGNDSLRYVFIVFYGAILYFIAKTMKAKGLKKPLTLAFSGNGSKTLNALSGSSTMIARFAKLIFDGVYNEKEGNISIIMEEFPKKATCKGGILHPVKQDYDAIHDLKQTIVGDNFDNVGNTNITYSEITDEIKSKVLEQINEFMVFLFKIHDNNHDFFTVNLAADPSVLQKVKEICFDKVEAEQSLNNGLSWKMNSLDDQNSTVSETLFFYPLVGILHEIARKISEA